MAPTSGSSHQPAILRLPLELRQLVYAQLLPKKLTAHPLPGVGFTQVSHPPPPSALLNIHPQLTDEILDYFYTITTWTLIFSHAFNFFRIDPDLRGLERSYVLRRVRKIECIVFCDVLLLREGITEGLDSFCAQIRKRVKRAADVLWQAEKLKSVSVSWLDSTSYAGSMELEAKARILAPLKRLRSKATPVTFCIGRIHGVEDEGQSKLFADCLRRVLGEKGGYSKSDGAPDTPDPAKLRLLAFDPKQNPQVYRSLNQERFAKVTRSNVITGAGVWRTVPT